MKNLKFKVSNRVAYYSLFSILYSPVLLVSVLGYVFVLVCSISIDFFMSKIW